MPLSQTIHIFYSQEALIIFGINLYFGLSVCQEPLISFNELFKGELNKWLFLGESNK